jgi:amino acid permease
MEEFESSMNSSKRMHKARFGLIVGYGFFVNTVVGAGFLSIPFAYLTGGWLLALCLQAGCIVLGLLYSYMVLETTSRIASIDFLKLEGCALPPIGFKGLFKEAPQPLIERKIPAPRLSQQQYDMSEMTDMLLGKAWGYFYLISLSVLFFGGLIAYTSIFGTSFVANIPLGTEGTCNVYKESSYSGNCRWKYMIFVVIYGAFMVYFTIVGLKKQWWMQIVLTFMRFLVMGLVIICCIVAIAGRSRLSSGKENYVTMPPLADFSQLGSVFPILLFSCLYQTNIPNIAVHIKDKRKNLPRILVLITFTLLTLYILLGLVAPAADSGLSSMVTLSFRNYTAGDNNKDGREWAYIIEYIVVIFPALDVFSIFPIIAITLADNISAMFFKQTTKEMLSKVRFPVEKGHHHSTLRSYSSASIGLCSV